MIDGAYSVETAKALLAKNKGKCDVFIFYDSNKNVVGTLSVMYKNGNDIEYKIRKADAFIYNVLTDEKHRGRGMLTRCFVFYQSICMASQLIKRILL